MCTSAVPSFSESKLTLNSSLVVVSNDLFSALNAPIANGLTSREVNVQPMKLSYFYCDDAPMSVE